MLFDNINELKKMSANDAKEEKILAYYPLEAQDSMLCITQKGNQKSRSEIIYSKHNCEVLDKRIERGILEEEKRLLFLYEKQKHAGRIAILSLIFLNLCCIGQFNLALLLCSTVFVSLHFQILRDLQKMHKISSYYVCLVEELKRGKIQLTKEEVELLNEEERNIYEINNEVSIGNLRVVCPPKVLKKRFGEK